MRFCNNKENINDEKKIRTIRIQKTHKNHQKIIIFTGFPHFLSLWFPWRRILFFFYLYLSFPLKRKRTSALSLHAITHVFCNETSLFRFLLSAILHPSIYRRGVSHWEEAMIKWVKFIDFLFSDLFLFLFIPFCVSFVVSTFLFLLFFVFFLLPFFIFYSSMSHPFFIVFFFFILFLDCHSVTFIDLLLFVPIFGFI